MIVPLNTSHFTRLATDARRDVDVLANLDGALRPLAGHWSRMRRDFLNLHRLRITHRVSYLLNLHQEPFILRRKSVWIDRRGRQQVDGIERRLVLVFLDAAVTPMNRNPDLESFLPSIIMGLMRFVTIAFATYSPLALLTFTCSPPVIPIRSASCAGISTNGSGTSCTFIGLFLVQ